MVIHYTKDNAGSFAKNYGLNEKQAKIIINHMEGHGYHLFDYDIDDECRMHGKEYPLRLYRLEVNEFAYKCKTDHVAVKREPLYVFDGFVDEYSINEAVITVREWIWGMIDCEEIEDENRLAQMEVDDAELAKLMVFAKLIMPLD